MYDTVRKEILENKIIAIIRGIDKSKILDTVKALLQGGIRILEITFNQRSEETLLETLESICLVKREFNRQVLLGAGTVLSEEQVISAIDAGAEFIISPNVDSNVIHRTREMGKVSVPGALTPSEIVSAHSAGADFVKLFPAGSLGIGYVKSLRGPLGHIPLLAVGGINEGNLCSFIEAGACGVGLGGNLVDKTAIGKGDYERISQMARNCIERSQGYSVGDCLA